MKVLSIVLGPCWAEVRGYRSRELLVEIGSRPVWSATRRAWSVSDRRGRDVAALAELRGYIVTVTEVGEQP